MTMPESCDDCGAGGAVFNKMFEGFLCGPCLRKWQERENARIWDDRRRLYRRLQTTGHNPPPVSCDFAKSNREIEALNPGAWTAARTWTDATNLFVYGPVGTGKTFLAYCVLIERIKRLQTVATVSGPAFARVAGSVRDAEKRLDLWSRAHVLHLDDLDKAIWTPSSLSGLWELFDTRIRAGRRTVITTNLSPESLREMLRSKAGPNLSLADAALDRLRPCTIIELTGRSLR